MWLFAFLASAVLGGYAGITAAKALDKAVGGVTTLFGLLPAGSLDPIPNDPTTNKPNYAKIVIVSVLVGVGILVVRWVGKKLHVKLFNKI